jgi:hypothetical protein
VDDNQARLYPAARSAYRNFVDAETFRFRAEEAAAVLLYAYFRYCAEVWEGYYSEQDGLSGSHFLDDERASEILADALSGKPLRWSDEGRGHPPQQKVEHTPLPPAYATPPAEDPEGQGDASPAATRGPKPKRPRARRPKRQWRPTTRPS